MVEEQKQEQTTTQAEPDMVTRAELAVAKLEKTLQETKAILEKNQATEARIILGGQSNNTQPQQTPEETPKEYAARIMRGGK